MLGLFWAWLVACWMLCKALILRSRATASASTGQIPVFAFFHPYASSGGGGERVLWKSIQVAQDTHGKHMRYALYHGDPHVSQEQLLSHVSTRFGISLQLPLEIRLLHTRHHLQASQYPSFTMLGQCIGAVTVACEALLLAPAPEIMFDTMGYAFAYPVFRWLGGCRVFAYVHYPMISSDMLDRVVRLRGGGSVSFSRIKVLYYRALAWAYGYVGSLPEKVFCNSSWTVAHIKQLWGGQPRVLYPPCDTSAFSAFPLDEPRKNHVVSVAQFRPEKDHALQLRAWAEFRRMSKGKEEEENAPVLILVGSCRDQRDEDLVQRLRDLACELEIEEDVRFRLNISYAELLEELRNAKVGLHSMWAEHFGIGVVEMAAAGAVTIAHRSGGPMTDILEHGKTGYLAETPMEYARAIRDSLKNFEDLRNLRNAARESMLRFSDKVFEENLDVS